MRKKGRASLVDYEFLIKMVIDLNKVYINKHFFHSLHYIIKIINDIIVPIIMNLNNIKTSFTQKILKKKFDMHNSYFII